MADEDLIISTKYDYIIKASKEDLITYHPKYDDSFSKILAQYSLPQHCYFGSCPEKHQIDDGLKKIPQVIGLVNNPGSLIDHHAYLDIASIIKNTETLYNFTEVIKMSDLNFAKIDSFSHLEKIQNLHIESNIEPIQLVPVSKHRFLQDFTSTCSEHDQDCWLNTTLSGVDSQYCDLVRYFAL